MERVLTRYVDVGGAEVACQVVGRAPPDAQTPNPACVGTQRQDAVLCGS
jgi:hypothetical protein